MFTDTYIAFALILYKNNIQPIKKFTSLKINIALILYKNNIQHSSEEVHECFETLDCVNPL